MQRKTIVALTSKLSPCIIAMEACCGAHHLGRVLSAQGHTLRLMSPEYVRPYVKAQKNDDRDAEAIAEAATRPTMRFVALKSEEQLDMQTLHRARDRAVGDRTSLMNQLRAVPKRRRRAITVCTNVSGLSATQWPRWRSARSGPHKGVARPFQLRWYG
jgi:transposase